MSGKTAQLVAAMMEAMEAQPRAGTYWMPERALHAVNRQRARVGLCALLGGRTDAAGMVLVRVDERGGEIVVDPPPGLPPGARIARTEEEKQIDLLVTGNAWVEKISRR